MKRMIGMVAFVLVCLSSLPSFAADGNDAATVSAESVRVVAAQPESLVVELPRESKRPLILPALYATFGAVQAWDVYTTSAALKSGGREANPVAAPFAGSTGRMIALKAATSAGTIFFVERIWRQNRVAAVLVMAGINGGMAAVAANNARIAQKRR